MIGVLDRFDDDELVALVTAVFVVTGAITYVVDALAVWIGWAAAMVLFVGVVMIQLNR
ncbi:hypothetical protein OB905_00910 [Halobacteria archaeon AArc-dxtr1]|nr:hypothetical protein [Halobacteria archaeon AArc-dxtr1]